MCPDSLSVTPGSHTWGLVPPWGIVDKRHFCFSKEQIFPYLVKSTILPLSLPFWDKTFSAIQRLVNFLKDFFRFWPFKIIPKVLTQNLKNVFQILLSCVKLNEQDNHFRLISLLLIVAAILLACVVATAFNQAMYSSVNLGVDSHKSIPNFIETYIFMWIYIMYIIY